MRKGVEGDGLHQPLDLGTGSAGGSTLTGGSTVIVGAETYRRSRGVGPTDAAGVMVGSGGGAVVGAGVTELL